MSAQTRALPWTDLLPAIGEERLAAIRSALEADHIEPLDRDAFLLHRAPGSLFRELVPEDGPAEAVNAYGTLLHMLYVMWLHDWPVASGTTHHAPRTTHSAPRYTQLTERRYWAQRDASEPHEPIDGIFAFERGGVLHLQAVLGMHDQRDGFSTIEADVKLPLEPPGQRDDGSPAYAPVMPAGERAGLHSVVSPAELAWLGG